RAAEGRIETSLFGATEKAGIPDAITMQMAQILATKMDFMKDLQQGDEFRIIYETHSTDGHYSAAGRILALEVVNKGKTHEAIWFKPDGEAGGYFDLDGQSQKGAVLTTALKFTRISTKFGMRIQPMHAKRTGHKRVGYAGPAASHIHATADGVIRVIGQQRG